MTHIFRHFEHTSECRVQLLRGATIAVLIVALSSIGCRQSPGSTAVDSGPEQESSDTESPSDTTARTDADDTGDGLGVEDVDTRGDGDDADVDGDDACGVDSDQDGLTDCAEAELCTDPHDGDTDGDHLGDAEELQKYGTSPCDTDTDGDGVPDNREVELGLDPTKKETYDDGIPDGERWVVKACRQGSPRSVQFHTNQTGDWKVGLASTYSNYRNLSLPGTNAPVAAAAYGAPSDEIAAFLLTSDVPAEQSSPSDGLGGHVRDAIESFGSVEHNLLDADYTTHNGDPAAHYEVRLALSSPRSARRLRDELLGKLAPVERSEIQGLPSSSGRSYERFRVEVGLIERASAVGQHSNLYTLAVVPDDRYGPNTRIASELGNLTNTTSLASASDRPAKSCERLRPGEAEPTVELYWMLGAASARITVRAVGDAAARIARLLDRSSVDYRLGVTNDDPDNRGRLHVPPGWHRKPGVFEREVRTRAYPCERSSTWHCDPAKENSPLSSAMLGLQYMKGSTPDSPGPAEKIRPGADVVMISAVEEKPQGKHRRSAEAYLSSYTRAYYLVPDSVRRGPDGLIRCSGEGIGTKRAFRDIANASGGAFIDSCAVDMNLALHSIMFDAIAEASELRLGPRPITSTLRVYLDGQWVPRNRENGYEYFPKDNTLAFFGDYRPTFERPDSQAPSVIAVHFETYHERCKSAKDPNACDF